MRIRLPILALAATALSVGATPAAQADITGTPLRVGLVGGAHLTADDLDVSGTRTADTLPGVGALVGLRVGWRIIRALELEASLQVFPSGLDAADGSAIILPLHLDAVLRPFRGMVIPYASVGAGIYALVGGDAGRDVDALVHTALGVELGVGTLAFRLEAGLYITDGVDSAAVSPAITLGVDILAWSEDDDDDDDDLPDVDAIFDPDRADADGDGILDVSDDCRQRRGAAALGGCPDTDTDGVADIEDRCPTRPGSTRHDGCPDDDGDSLDDLEDACPFAPGTAETYGCPEELPR